MGSEGLVISISNLFSIKTNINEWLILNNELYMMYIWCTYDVCMMYVWCTYDDWPTQSSSSILVEIRTISFERHQEENIMTFRVLAGNTSKRKNSGDKEFASVMWQRVRFCSDLRMIDLFVLPIKGSMEGGKKFVRTLSSSEILVLMILVLTNELN